MKILCIRICLALLVVFLPASAASQTGPVLLQVEEVEGYPLETVEVALVLSNPSGASGGEFILVYDPALVRPDSVRRGSLTAVTGGCIFLSNLEYSDNSLKIAWAGLKEQHQDGTVAVLTFQLLKPGSSALEVTELTLSDKDSKPIPADVVSGEITVLPAQPGRPGARPVIPAGWICAIGAMAVFILFGWVLVRRFRKNSA